MVPQRCSLLKCCGRDPRLCSTAECCAGYPNANDGCVLPTDCRDQPLSSVNGATHTIAPHSPHRRSWCALSQTRQPPNTATPPLPRFLLMYRPVPWVHWQRCVPSVWDRSSLLPSSVCGSLPSEPGFSLPRAQRGSVSERRAEGCGRSPSPRQDQRSSRPAAGVRLAGHTASRPARGEGGVR